MKEIVAICLVMSTSLSLATDNGSITFSNGQQSPPYAFNYEAGRYPGHIDRTHSQVSDGSGIVRGTYSYTDPNQVIRSGQYVTDRHNSHHFSNDQSFEPQQTQAVRQARARHFNSYDQIARDHAQATTNHLDAYNHIARDHAQAVTNQLDLYNHIARDHAQAASNHLYLYNQIAQRNANGYNRCSHRY